MAEQKWESRSDLVFPGPYLARVVNHLDPTYMGSLSVTILRGIPGLSETESSNVMVRYCSPFAGQTSVKYEGNNPNKFNDVQKSYGMWMVPPDIGTIVMVMFVEGDINQGYWMGCVPDMYQNHMVPGIAASEQVAKDSDFDWGTGYLPVAEFHKGTKSGNIPNPNSFTKPIHPFANTLLKQGLLVDKIRGVTSSSARRERPSTVFGISTPGPIDTSKDAPRFNVQFNKKTVNMPVSRLGGTTFVMDDGDKNGDNELVRIRTRTGHQILLHNTKDLIYIANAQGTAWMEFTSNGKIDMFAQDSVSIHTMGDFNFRADRDFNLEAGRNVNINAVDGNINLAAAKEVNSISDSIKIQTAGNISLTSSADMLITVAGDVSASAADEIKMSSANKFSIGSTGGLTAVGAGGDLSLKAASITASASRIDLNGPEATQPSAPGVAEIPVPLNLFENPQSVAGGVWAGGNFGKGSPVISIMQRVPSHEPWQQHEDADPATYSLEKTDSNITPTTVASNGATIPSKESASVPFPSSNGPGGDRGTVQGQPFSWTTDQPFLNKIKEVCGRLNFDPLDLIGIMFLESAGSMDPAKPNGVGYFGLIQFGPAAATSLKTTTTKLAKMGRVEQMDQVEKYFRLWGWPNAKVGRANIAQIYMTVFLPAFRFYGLDDIACSASDPKTRAFYTGNPSFDPAPKKGFITPRMVAAAAEVRKRAALQALSNNGTGLDLVVTKK